MLEDPFLAVPQLAAVIVGVSFPTGGTHCLSKVMIPDRYGAVMITFMNNL